MSSFLNQNSRGPIRQTTIIHDLRDLIIKGLLEPGQRLPTRLEIESQYGVSSVTVQRALDQLMRDGFVISRGSLGSFVSQTPPHLYRYALCFGFGPHDDDWSSFYATLATEGQALSSSTSRRVVSYYNVSGHTDSEDYRRLECDLSNRCLAGVIFAHRIHRLVGSPLMENLKSPAAVVSRTMDFPHLPHIVADIASCFDKSLDYLKKQGRKKLAVVILPNLPDVDREHLLAAAAARGLPIQPHLIQAVPANAATWANNAVQAMMRAAPADRPDALLVTSDVLVPYATAGLLAVGAKVPRQVEVVAFGNFPDPTPSMVPARRVGFRPRDILQTAIQAIDNQRSGKPHLSTWTIPGNFEEDFSL